MIEKLLEDIIDYFEYLKQTHGYFIAFHNSTISIYNYMVKLSPYNINSNPYCLCVKTSSSAWEHCIKRQPKVFKKCADGIFCGTCYAGMGEYVFPIIDDKVLGFIDISGFCFDLHKSQTRLKYVSREYSIPTYTLVDSFMKNVKDAKLDITILKKHISPLCHMFILLNRELTKIYGNILLQRDTYSNILSHSVVFLNRNYTQPIHVSDIAEACHCSTSYISHIFKKNIGYSINEYINQLRIKDVKNFLISTNFSMKQISEMVGYCSPNYMSEVFKNTVGISPRSYRRQKKAEK